MSLISFLRNPLANLSKRAFHAGGQEPLASTDPGSFVSPEVQAEQQDPLSLEVASGIGGSLGTDFPGLLQAIPDRLFLFNRRGDCLGSQGQGSAGGEEYTGQNIREIDAFRGNSDLILGWIERTLDSHAVQAVQFRASGPQAAFFEARFTPFNENAVLAILRDITEQKRAEQSTHLAKAELEMRLEQHAGELEHAEKQLALLEQDLRRELSARERLEELRLHDAFHDALTGLPNRALITERLERVIERMKRHRHAFFSVLCLDLDRFQVINDSLGHNFGDRLLVKISRRLEGLLRGADTVARLGGDEFAILVEEIKEERVARMIAWRVLKAFEQPFDVDGSPIFASASIGIMLSKLRYTDPAEALRDAELAMYHAKKLGKARIEVFDPAMRQRAITRLELESRLRGALDRKEFHLHYQAIQELQSGRISGFEALLRWNPPGQAPISPAEFIPVAEETGLILPIGEWVLREACAQMRAWQAQHPYSPPLAINVNISSRQFTHPALAKQVARILVETGLEPDSLRLEITESTFMQNAELATRILSELQTLGVQFQIDDFGTGYSSLSYLQQFPVHTIKIDRAFIGRLGKDGHNAEIVRTILRLANDLGMGTIAEGIETEDQLAQLKTLDCPLGQGFFIARPMEPEKAAALLAGETEALQPLQR